MVVKYWLVKYTAERGCYKRREAAKKLLCFDFLPFKTGLAFFLERGPHFFLQQHYEIKDESYRQLMEGWKDGRKEGMVLDLLS
jgi:hypothetical protein